MDNFRITNDGEIPTLSGAVATTLSASPPRAHMDCNASPDGMTLFFKFTGPDDVIIISPESPAEHLNADEESFFAADPPESLSNFIRWELKRFGPSMAIAPPPQQLRETAAVVASTSTAEPILMPAQLLIGKWAGKIVEMEAHDGDDDDACTQIEVMMAPENNQWSAEFHSDNTVQMSPSGALGAIDGTFTTDFDADSPMITINHHGETEVMKLEVCNATFWTSKTLVKRFW